MGPVGLEPTASGSLPLLASFIRIWSPAPYLARPRPPILTASETPGYNVFAQRERFIAEE